MKGLGFIVGVGDNARFWYDDWVSAVPLHLLFPRVFKVVSNKESSVKECFVGLGIWCLGILVLGGPFVSRVGGK